MRLRAEVKRLQEDLLDLETHSRKYKLFIDGSKENQDEDMRKVVVTFFNGDLTLSGRSTVMSSDCSPYKRKVQASGRKVYTING